MGKQCSPQFPILGQSQPRKIASPLDLILYFCNYRNMPTAPNVARYADMFAAMCSQLYAVNAMIDPNTARYASAIHDLSDTALK